MEQFITAGRLTRLVELRVLRMKQRRPFPATLFEDLELGFRAWQRFGGEPGRMAGAVLPGVDAAPGELRRGRMALADAGRVVAGPAEATRPGLLVAVTVAAG